MDDPFITPLQLDRKLQENGFFGKMKLGVEIKCLRIKIFFTT